MEFRKYQHIERFGTDEVLGIEDGLNYVFPKIDGTNSSVWLDDGVIKAGSRNRELTLDKDNAGFCAWVLEQENLLKYLEKFPHHRLFGEWLIPHSLKTYRQEAWRNFYVFDVCTDSDEEKNSYLPYEMYKPWLDVFNIEYIPPIGIIKGGSYEKFMKCIEKNMYLIEDGKGLGEGIVIKNYSYFNKYGRQTWAKIVRNEFKDKHSKEMGAPTIEVSKMTEEKIVEEYCTEAFIEKEYAKIVTEKDGWTSKYISELLGRIFSTLIKEESWNIVKKHKYPTINFKTLNCLVIRKIKQVKSDVF